MIPGKKVRLRAYRDDDIKNMLAAINNGAVTRYLQSMRPVSQAQEREFLESAMRADDPSNVSFAIESASTWVASA